MKISAASQHAVDTSPKLNTPCSVHAYGRKDGRKVKEGRKEGGEEEGSDNERMEGMQWRHEWRKTCERRKQEWSDEGRKEGHEAMTEPRTSSWCSGVVVVWPRRTLQPAARHHGGNTAALILKLQQKKNARKEGRKEGRKECDVHCTRKS
jgi:hypothetical protein